MKEEFLKYTETIPAVAQAARLEETFWINDKMLPGGEKRITQVCPEQIKDASDRLLRFAP